MSQKNEWRQLILVSDRLEKNVERGLRLPGRSRKEWGNTSLGNGNDGDTAFHHDLEDRIVPSDSD